MKRLSPTRGPRFWDRVSGTTNLVERLPTAATMHRIMLDAVGLAPGHAALDLGCGAGAYFEPLRRTVGAEGRVYGVDSSPTMIERARRRIHRHGWENVEAVRVDATSSDLGNADFDAVFALYSVSAMPDIGAAVERAYTALRPGGRLFLADVRFVPDGRASTVIRGLRAMYRKFAAATGDDVVPYVRETFDSVRELDSKGETVPWRLRPWPPLIMLVADKDAHA